MDVAKTGKRACFGCKKKKKVFQLFFVSVIQQNGQIAATYLNTTGFAQTLIVQSSTEQERSHLAVKTQRRSTYIMHSSCGKFLNNYSKHQ